MQVMASKQKAYAVIYFESENLYSEVPVTWLTTDRKKCWWPKSLNAKANMTRGDRPQENWVLHDVRVEKYCSTLNSARLRAENPEYSSSNETQKNKGRGLRKKLQKKYSSSEEASNDEERITPSITPPPTPLVNTVTCTLDDVVVLEVPPGDFMKTNKDEEQPLSTMQGSQIIYACQGETPISVDKHNDTLHKELQMWTQEVTEDDASQNILEEDETTKKKCDCEKTEEKTILKEMYIKLSKLERMMEGLSRAFNSLKTSDNVVIYNEKKADLLEQLPLNDKEALLEFDKKISSEQNMKETYSSYIRGIGGKDMKDFVNRCLNCLFTNQLGTICSLVGQRGNLRLEGFEFIKIFQEIVLTTKGSSSYEVEKAIGEWFRLSNQRLTRQNKKENK